MIYTDSKYAHHTRHAHAAVRLERGFLTGKNSPIKHRAETLQSFEAVKSSTRVASFTGRGHQSNTDEISQGNNFADKTAKQAAFSTIKVLPLFPIGFTFQPNHTPQEALKAREKS